jgi:hypothetical protein
MGVAFAQNSDDADLFLFRATSEDSLAAIVRIAAKGVVII